MRVAILALATLGAASGSARAGVNEWTGIGPDGGRVTALAIARHDPNILYAGTIGGMFKSIDGGANWKSANSGLPESPAPLSQNVITSIAVDPRNSGTVYAGITGQTIILCDGGCNIPVDGGIFKSGDGGTTWHRVTSGLEAVWFYTALTIDPQNSDIIYAATYRSVTDKPNCTERRPCFNGEVFKSTDRAATWAAASNGIPPADTRVFSLAIDPKASSTLYAAATGIGIFKTTDAGANWSAVLASPILFLTIDPHNPSTLYAVANAAIVKTQDGGATWNAPTRTPATFLSLAIDAQNPGTRYALTAEGQMFKSTDEGGSWSVAAGPPATAFSLVADPQSPGVVYAANRFGRGIFKTTDAAASWSAANSGLRQTLVSALAADPNRIGTIYASANVGLVKTTDGGQTWIEVNSGLRETAEISSIAVDPKDPSVLYAIDSRDLAPPPIPPGGNPAPRPIPPGGIFKSTDGGTSWNAANSGFGEQVVRIRGPLLVAPGNPSVIHVTAFESGGTYSIFESTDGAATWMRIGMDYDLRAIDPRNLSSTLYGVSKYGVLSRSNDDGASWSDLALPREASTDEDDDAWINVLYVAVDPQNPSIVYATGSGGIFKSTDGGENWRSLNSGFPAFVHQNGCYEPYRVNLLAIDPRNSLNLYAIAAGKCESFASSNRIIRSTDGGTSWSVVNSGLPSLVAVLSLAIDANQPGTVYAATDDGVYAIAFVL